jgi:3-oxoacid CoA-transferase
MLMDKVFASAADAIADLPDGATVALGGFSVGHRFALGLITALRDKGSRNLCLVCNSMGAAGELRGQILAENRQVRKLIAAFSVRPGMPTATEEQINAGEIEVELVPQGILVERCRAGGAGIPAFYTAAGADTDLARGKELREFGGRTHVMETAIQVDYAFIRAYRADRSGNVQFRGGSQNLSPAFAKAAKVAIVEVDEVVEVGELPPEAVNLPGIFVSRVVKSTRPYDAKQVPQSKRRPADTAREYNGKPALTRAGIARRAAALLREGTYVNLGTGIPTMISNNLEGRDIVLHAENGVLGYGRMVTGDAVDPDYYNASGQYIELKPGASFFDSVTSFEMARGGRIDTVVLGAYEVDQDGSVANWSTQNEKLGGIGGAMDLVSGGAELIIVMEHCDSKGRPKLKKKCRFPLTGRGCVDYVVTDLAVLKFENGICRLLEVAPGFTADEVIALTEMDVQKAAEVAVMA